jgi:hypothetical protein
MWTLMLPYISKHYIVKASLAFASALLTVGCKGTAKTVGGTPFAEYHGLYTPSNTKAVQQALHTNHPDYDWGLWGHNLVKAIGDGLTDDMYATVDGHRTHDQLCFSSPALYKAVREYILDQYGYGNDHYSERITIMPMDNKLACLCPRCRAAGNTPGNATPAVTAFITRLAKEFPRHQFFTSAYHTTRQAPAKALPDNVGVLISSYGLPVQCDFTRSKGYTGFMQMVKAWKQRCGRIYIWDYERNFDDYLSPFPCLLAMQARLQLYRKLGVRGVFFNGSGDDWSAFDDMQTDVLARLMDNPGLNVQNAVAEYFRQHYPVTAPILTNYYWGLEERTRKSNCVLPLYGSMKEMCAAYLDADAFAKFRKQLDAASKQTMGDERHRLNALLTALAYTQLELYRCGLLPKDADMATEMRIVLKGHSEIKGMVNRDESGHSIDNYLKQWK